MDCLKLKQGCRLYRVNACNCKCGYSGTILAPLDAYVGRVSVPISCLCVQACCGLVRLHIFHVRLAYIRVWSWFLDTPCDIGHIPENSNNFRIFQWKIRFRNTETIISGCEQTRRPNRKMEEQYRETKWWQLITWSLFSYTDPSDVNPDFSLSNSPLFYIETC